jgi:hypothetical protein
MLIKQSVSKSSSTTLINPLWYGRIRVTIEETTTIEFDGIIERNIPRWVEIEALPTEGGGGGIVE